MALIKLTKDLQMDNGAYASYRAQNPTTNIFITTYEKLAFFPDELTKEEIIVLGFFVSISLYAIFKIIHRIKKKPTQRNEKLIDFDTHT